MAVRLRICANCWSEIKILRGILVFSTAMVRDFRSLSALFFRKILNRLAIGLNLLDEIFFLESKIGALPEQ